MTPWRPQHTEAERDFHARYAPSPAVTLADVWRMVAQPTGRFFNRHARAAKAARLAYQEKLK